MTAKERGMRVRTHSMPSLTRIETMNRSGQPFVAYAYATKVVRVLRAVHAEPPSFFRMHGDDEPIVTHSCHTYNMDLSTYRRRFHGEETSPLHWGASFQRT